MGAKRRRIEAAQDAAAGDSRRYVRRSGKRRGRAETRGQLRDRATIDGPPALVDRRGRYGDWEGDTLVGAGHRGGAVTLVERKSGYLLLGNVPNLKAAAIRQTAATLVRPTAPALRKTLTLDSGKGFAEHKELAAETGLAVYFAKPYCAWQRGTNEKTNGLIRQFFAKGTDLASVPERRFTKVQHLLNTRRRRRVGYRTPHEVLASLLPVVIET
jgi:IS30 family transposase